MNIVGRESSWLGKNKMAGMDWSGLRKEWLGGHGSGSAELENLRRIQDLERKEATLSIN